MIEEYKQLLLYFGVFGVCLCHIYFLWVLVLVVIRSEQGEVDGHRNNRL